MKKPLLPLLLSLSLLSSFLGACEDSAPTSPTPSPKVEPAATAPPQAAPASPMTNNPITATYRMLSGEPGGNYFQAATELRSVLQQAGFGLEVKESVGSVENMKALSEGKVDFAFVQLDALLLQKAQDQERGGKVFENLRIFAQVSDEYVHIITNKKAGIRSLKDLRGKRVAVGPSGSGTYVSALLIYFADDLDDRDLKTMPIKEAIAKVQVGELDAAFFTTTIGAPLLKEITAEAGQNLELLPIEDVGFLKPKRLDRVYSISSIPANSYPWQTREAKTLVTLSGILVNKSLPDDRAAEIAQILYGNAAALQSKNRFWQGLDLERAKNDDLTLYHPGVIKFLKK